MNGIEKITDRISADAQSEIDQMLSASQARAAEITAKYQAQADAEGAEIAARNQKAAAEREERLVSVAQMEARKVTLAAKQEMVERAYALALEKLCAMPEEQYVEVLASLLAQASSTGQEEVIFSPEDAPRVGKAAVAKANERLGKASAPKAEAAPKTDAAHKAGGLLGKAVAAISNKEKTPAVKETKSGLTLSAETRPIKGGFILKDENVETNCTFDTLVRLQKAETAGAVAKKLFPQS